MKSQKKYEKVRRKLTENEIKNYKSYIHRLRCEGYTIRQIKEIVPFEMYESIKDD